MTTTHSNNSFVQCQPVNCPRNVVSLQQSLQASIEHGGSLLSEKSVFYFGPCSFQHCHLYTIHILLNHPSSSVCAHSPMALRLRHWLAIAISSSFALQALSLNVASINNIATDPLNYANTVDSPKYHRIVIAHAALACLAWVIFAPLGAILLRSGLRGVNLLKLHAFWQLAVFAM
jgi:hypothetical protein